MYPGLQLHLNPLFVAFAGQVIGVVEVAIGAVEVPNPMGGRLVIVGARLTS
jgi:hypothetical protein